MLFQAASRGGKVYQLRWAFSFTPIIPRPRCTTGFHKTHLLRIFHQNCHIPASPPYNNCWATEVLAEWQCIEPRAVALLSRQLCMIVDANVYLGLEEDRVSCGASDSQVCVVEPDLTACAYYFRFRGSKAFGNETLSWGGVFALPTLGGLR